MLDNGVERGGCVTELVVAAFAFVVGLNDGSPLIAQAAAAGARRPLVRVAVLAATLALLPGLVSADVARTYAAGVVDLGTPSGGLVTVVAVLVATGVVVALHRLHRPTSLTLALIGALAGAAVGAGLAVHWSAVGRVLALGALAPLAAGILGFVAFHAFGALNGLAPTGRTLAVADRVGFGIQTVAYSLNDGQKVLLVPLVLLGATALDGPRTMAAVALGFAGGAAVGLSRARRATTVRVVPAHPQRLVAVEVVSSVVGASGAALGAPLSMSQSCAAANVGSGAAGGVGRVRWSEARTMGVAWLVTLPAAGAAALVVVHVLLAVGG